MDFLYEKNVDTYIRSALKARTAIYPQKKASGNIISTVQRKTLKMLGLLEKFLMSAGN
jgi:hypothetical protein